MSDMSRPASRMPAADHDRHDTVLVAQLAAGDPLAETQRSEAQRLVSSCGACAELAADLRSVAVAVASERVPRRRRDFRLQPEQAERLRASAVVRFLRRLTLPQARVFRPAAAGIMSVGLALAVVGYAWPDDGVVPTSADGVPAPAAIEVLASPPLDRALAPAPMEAPTSAEGAMEEPEAQALEVVDDATLGDAAEKSRVDRGMSADDAAGATEEAGAAEAFAAADALDESETLAGTAADDEASEGREALTSAASEATAPEPYTGETGATAPATVAGGDTGADLQSALLVVGLGMALVGGSGLVLAWLARRTRDPLLP